MGLAEFVGKVFDVDHIAAVYDQVHPGIFHRSVPYLNALVVRPQTLDPQFGKLYIQQGISMQVLDIHIPDLDSLKEGITDRGDADGGPKLFR